MLLTPKCLMVTKRSFKDCPCVLGGNPDVAVCVRGLAVRYVPDPRLIWKQNIKQKDREFQKFAI